MRLERQGIVLALDLPSPTEALKLLKKTRKHIVGVKISWPMIIDHSIHSWSFLDLLEYAHKNGLPVIADLKLGDIENTDINIIAALRGTTKEGLIDYVTLQGLALSRSTLSECVHFAHDNHIGTFVVAKMTDGFDRLSEVEAKVMPIIIAKHAAMKLSDGVVLPATDPSLIAECRRVLGPKMLIMSPGVKVQGAKPGDAIRAGANFEVVGRAIYEAKDPTKTARSILKQMVDSVYTSDDYAERRAEAIIAAEERREWGHGTLQQ
jgi:orotidine-5'-phosphate decarboxylase